MHGLVHLLYFVSYWPIAEMEEVPYKTTLLNGRWDIGPGGIRLFGFLCLLATLGFVFAAYGFAFQAGWWRSLLAIVIVFSLVLTSLLLDGRPWRPHRHHHHPTSGSVCPRLGL
jgi:hypothetical protein